MKHFFTTVSALLLASMSSLAAEIVPYVHDFNDADCLQEWSVLAHSDRVRFKYVEARQAPVYGYRNCVCSNSIYSGGSIETKDSWLISPAISLEGGKEYIVTYHYALTNTAREYLGIFYCTEPTAEAMTTEALAMYFYFGKGFLEESAGMILECKIKPETTGTYYIGFYDNADKYSSAITAVYDFSVTEAASGQMPSVPTDFTLIPDQTGKLEVELSAKAPAIDANGDPIASLLSMEFIRGKEVIHTIETPVPGSIYTYIDKNPANGNNTYGVRAVNESGTSNLVQEIVKVGVGLPDPVTELEAVQISPGRVKASWKKPSRDITGFALDPSLVKSKVEVWKGENLVNTYEDIEDSEFEFDICAPDAVQDFYSLHVYAVTTGGESLVAELHGLTAGESYKTPFEETFPEGSPTHPFYISSDEKYRATWEYIIYDENLGVGCARFKGSAVTAQASLYSGSIAIPEDEETKISFKYSTLGDSDNELSVIVVSPAGAETIGTVKGMTTDQKDAEFDLSPYKGQDIQFALCGKYISGGFYIMVTDIRVGNQVGSGVSDFGNDKHNRSVYYDINGYPISNPERGRFMIKVENGKSERVIMK